MQKCKIKSTPDEFVSDYDQSTNVLRVNVLYPRAFFGVKQCEASTRNAPAVIMLI